MTLTYEELREIVKNKLNYADWHTALASIYAIYLIEDKKSGKKYVGSAYGKGGLENSYKEKFLTRKFGLNGN